MKEPIKITKRENKTDHHNNIAEVARMRRGVAVAACLAFAVVGLLAAVLLFSDGMAIDEPLEQPAQNTSSAEDTSDTDVPAAAFDKALLNYSKIVYNTTDDEVVACIAQVQGSGGSCIETSFEELDIQLETTLNMSDYMVAVFTISKKDGTAFESVEGYSYSAGICAKELFIDGIAYGGYENEPSKVYMNDDGTLTLLAMCSGIDFPEDSGRSLDDCSCRIKLTGLYLTPDFDYWIQSSGSEEYIERDNELRELERELQNDYFTETYDAFGENGLTEDEIYKAEQLSDAYNEKLSGYLEAIKEQSKDSYSGTAVFKISDMSDRSVQASASGFNITADPFNVKAAGTGDPEEVFNGTTPNFEIHLKTGDVIDIPVNKDFISWSNGVDGYIWDYVHQFNDKPLDISQIDYFVFYDVKIELS